MKASHVFFLVTGYLALGSAPAQAYVRAIADTGVPLWWRTPCITMEIFLGDPPPTMTADQYFKASQLAARTWSQPALACTNLTLTVQKNSAATADVGFDGKNVIVFRKDAWCENSDAATGPCYPSNALAVTSDFKSNTTGEIIDADMELNAVGVHWADLATNPTPTNSSTADFQNTLTHELGHVIGLAHNCYSPNDASPVLKDNTGNDEVTCTNPDVPPSVRDATMYPVVAMSDTERRTLSPDDVQAVCEIYPSTDVACHTSSAQGCAFVAPSDGRSSQGWTFGLIAGAVALLLGFTIRRRCMNGLPRRCQRPACWNSREFPKEAAEGEDG